MHRIDNTTATPTLELPRPIGTPGFFSNGSELTGLDPTVVDSDWMNAVQEELAYLVETSGLVLNKQDRTQVYQAITRLTRLRLNAPATFWCAPDGDDGNPGTQAQPFASISYAYRFIRDRIDMNGHQCTIRLADGVYAGAECAYPAVGPWVRILGNEVNPSATTLHGVNVPAILIQQNAGVHVQSVRLTATGPAGAPYSPAGIGLSVQAGALFGMQNIHFDLCTWSHISCDNGATGGAQGMNYTYTILGGAPFHVTGSRTGSCGYYGAQISIYNNPHFSEAFASTWGAGMIDFRDTQFYGTATGKRFDVGSQGLIHAFRNLNEFLPGDQDGTNNGGYVPTAVLRSANHYFADFHEAA